MLDSTTTVTPLPRRVPIESGGVAISATLRGSFQETIPGRQSMTPIDLQELENEYVVYVYVEHCPQERLSVTVQDNILVIKNLSPEPLHQNHASSDWYDGFSFCFLLPAAANGATAHAYCQGSLLRVVIQKRFT